MADSGEMEVFPDGVVQVGDSPPDREETGVLILSEGGYLDSSKIRRSARKKLLRSLANQGRLAKSRPKSPLMRMVEMRKGGLRGRDLRQSGLKGSEGSISKSSKGLKGIVGRGSHVLEAIPECNGAGVELEEGLRGEGRAGGGVGVPGRDADVMAEDRSVEDLKATIILGSPARKPEEGCSKQTELIPAGVLSDLALDLMSAQPLQDMVFVGEQVIPAVDVGDSGKDCLMVELNQVEGNGRNMEACDLVLGMDEEFPQLSKESLRTVREKERNRGVGGKEQPIKGKLDKDKEGQNGGQISKVDGNKWFGDKNYKASLADGVNTRDNVSVSFEPEKIRKMGVPGVSSGLPSIHFSGAETSFLAEKQGYAIVGNSPIPSLHRCTYSGRFRA